MNKIIKKNTLFFVILKSDKAKLGLKHQLHAKITFYKRNKAIN